MVRLSVTGVIYVIVLFAMLFLLDGKQRRWSTRANIAVEGAAPGLIVAIYINNSMDPWTLPAFIAWTIVVMCGSVIATAVAWLATVRISSRTGRRIVGLSTALLAGAATVSVAVLAIRQARPNLLADPVSSIVAIGALAGALAGAFLEFNRRRAWCAN